MSAQLAGFHLQKFRPTADSFSIQCYDLALSLKMGHIPKKNIQHGSFPEIDE
jgi:hypothetical protein